MMFADGTEHPLGSTYDGYLPNITGGFRFSDDNDTTAGVRVANTDGCFYGNSGTHRMCNANGASNQNAPDYVSFSASRSSAAYGRNSSEFGGFVLPRAVHMYYIVKY